MTLPPLRKPLAFPRLKLKHWHLPRCHCCSCCRCDTKALTSFAHVFCVIAVKLTLAAVPMLQNLLLWHRIFRNNCSGCQYCRCYTNNCISVSVVSVGATTLSVLWVLRTMSVLLLLCWHWNFTLLVSLIWHYHFRKHCSHFHCCRCSSDICRSACLSCFLQWHWHYCNDCSQRH